MYRKLSYRHYKITGVVLHGMSKICSHYWGKELGIASDCYCLSSLRKPVVKTITIKENSPQFCMDLLHC